MLSEKPWKPEDVLRLATSVLLCLVVGMLVVTGVGRLLPDLSKADRNFTSFAIGALSFQGATLVLVHFFLREHGLSWREAFGLAWEEWGRSARWACGTIAVALPLVVALGKGTEYLLVWLGVTPDLQITVKMLQNHPPLGHLIGYGAGAVLLAPAAEEVMFRGILYPTLKQSGYPQLALWITSLLFASIHVNLLAFVPMTFLSIALVWLYERTGNLLAPILTHVLFNAVNFALLIAAPDWLKMN